MPGAAASSFPPATGRRTQWAELPGAVRAAVEERLGGRVVAARSQPGGFSPGVAARVELADGTRAFVKAVCGAPNPDSPELHRREARIASALPLEVPAPALRFCYDDGDWVVLAYDDVDGHNPELPWRAAELSRVLAALHALAIALTPSPIALDGAPVALARLFGGWQKLAADPVLLRSSLLPAGLRAPIRDRLADLVALEAEWPRAVRGETLVHLDLRADNIVLAPDRVYFVDWPGAAIGAAWLDLVAMLPSVAMQGGPDPDDVWRAHPLSRGVDDPSVDAFVAAPAGYFVHASVLAPPPGLPTLRPFQAAEGDAAFRRLVRRRGSRDSSRA